MATLLTGAWEGFEKFFGIGGHTTANTTGMDPKSAAAATDSATISDAGALTAIFGGLTSAVGSYYAAKTAQYQAQSQASALNFQADMDAINARQAEMSAQSIQEAGQQQVMRYTMQAGQEKAASQVATAARGVDLSSGSAVTERASQDLVKSLDVLTISSNATRAAWAQRTQATNYSNESLLARTSAVNTRTSAESISPGLAFSTSLLGSATQIASQWDYRRRLALSTAGRGTPTPNGFGNALNTAFLSAGGQ